MKDAVEIAKADALWRRDLVDKAERKKKKRWGPASNRTAVGGLIGPVGSTLGAGSAAKHGHRTGVGVKAGTRSAFEGGLGATLGSGVGTAAGLITHNPAIAAGGALGGAALGGIAGSVHGGVKSVNNSRKLRQLRPGM